MENGIAFGQYFAEYDPADRCLNKLSVHFHFYFCMLTQLPGIIGYPYILGS